MKTTSNGTTSTSRWEPRRPAEQVLSDTLDVRTGEQLRVHGADGVTGGLLVLLAALRGAQVIATAGSSSQQPVTAVAASYRYSGASVVSVVVPLTGC